MSTRIRIVSYLGVVGCQEVLGLLFNSWAQGKPWEHVPRAQVRETPSWIFLNHSLLIFSFESPLFTCIPISTFCHFGATRAWNHTVTFFLICFFNSTLWFQDWPPWTQVTIIFSLFQLCNGSLYKIAQFRYPFYSWRIHDLIFMGKLYVLLLQGFRFLYFHDRSGSLDLWNLRESFWKDTGYLMTEDLLALPNPFLKPWPIMPMLLSYGPLEGNLGMCNCDTPKPKQAGY